MPLNDYLVRVLRKFVGCWVELDFVGPDLGESFTEAGVLKEVAGEYLVLEDGGGRTVLTNVVIYRVRVVSCNGRIK